MELLKKVKHSLSYDPVITFLNIYPRKINRSVNIKTCTQVLIAVLFARDKHENNPSIYHSINGQVNRWYIHTTEYY